MQGFEEAGTWFPANTDKYRFRLSMRSQDRQECTSGSLPSTPSHYPPVEYAGTAPAVSPTLLTPTSGISGLSLASPITGPFPDASALPPPPPLLPSHPPRAPLPRNNSFPTRRSSDLRLTKARSPLTCPWHVLTSMIGKHSSPHDTEPKGGRLCE